jgi:protein-tyrosine phosphatase
LALIDGSPIDERRIVALEGGRNFRDLGGYRTQDGRCVKWGKIFRSGSMAGLTPADYERLAKLSIKTICDLRTVHEREVEPNNWYRVANIMYWARDYGEGFGELRSLMASSLSTPEAARAAMINGYRRLPFQQAPAYREVFSRLAAGQVPLAFNCSAGKDRAGTAAALILSALGVARESVVEDYLLTDRVIDLKSVFMERAQKRNSTLMNQSPDLVAAILRSDADYLDAAFDAIEQKHGSVAAYLQDALGLNEEAMSAIRQQLLE